MKSHALLFISFRVLIVILKSLKVPQHELSLLWTNFSNTQFESKLKVKSIKFSFLKVISMVIQNLWQTGSQEKFKCPKKIFCLEIDENLIIKYCNIATTLLLHCYLVIILMLFSNFNWEFLLSVFWGFHFFASSYHSNNIAII